MQKLGRTLAKILTLVVISSFGLMNHAVAMPSSLHSMVGMDHNSSVSSTARCAALCTSVVFSKVDPLGTVYDQNDDEPVTQFYMQSQRNYLCNACAHNSCSGLTLRPPPKVPIYIRYQVFRV